MYNNILWFQIPMNNVLGMQVGHGPTKLVHNDGYLFLS
jgi:hypothetical protein